ncbi:MAG: hypothetical protein ACJAYI_000802 [Myxococcota bacterium]|jgi:hypothetical protein
MSDAVSLQLRLPQSSSPLPPLFPFPPQATKKTLATTKMRSLVLAGITATPVRQLAIDDRLSESENDSPGRNPVAPLDILGHVRRDRNAALVHESESWPFFLDSEGLRHPPIAEDSSRPSSVIRFWTLHAISASVS